MTGQREQPKVQQQQRHPQNSHLTLTGRVFLRTLFILVIVALYSSGATLADRAAGNSVSNLLLKPNTVILPAPRMTTGSGRTVMTLSSK